MQDSFISNIKINDPYNKLELITEILEENHNISIKKFQHKMSYENLNLECIFIYGVFDYIFGIIDNLDKLPNKSKLILIKDINFNNKIEFLKNLQNHLFQYFLNIDTALEIQERHKEQTILDLPNINFKIHKAIKFLKNIINHMNSTNKINKIEYKKLLYSLTKNNTFNSLEIKLLKKCIYYLYVYKSQQNETLQNIYTLRNKEYLQKVLDNGKFFDLNEEDVLLMYKNQKIQDNLAEHYNIKDVISQISCEYNEEIMQLKKKLEEEQLKNLQLKNNFNQLQSQIESQTENSIIIEYQDYDLIVSKNYFQTELKQSNNFKK